VVVLLVIDMQVGVFDGQPPQLAYWHADPSYAPPGGESLAVVQARSLNLVEELVAAYSGAWLVLVTRVGPIKGLLCAALQAPLTVARHLLLDEDTRARRLATHHESPRDQNAQNHDQGSELVCDLGCLC